MTDLVERGEIALKVNWYALVVDKKIGLNSLTGKPV